MFQVTQAARSWLLIPAFVFKFATSVFSGIMMTRTRFRQRPEVQCISPGARAAAFPDASLGPLAWASVPSTRGWCPDSDSEPTGT